MLVKCILTTVTGDKIEVQYKQNHEFSTSSFTSNTIHMMTKTKDKLSFYIQGDKIVSMEVIGEIKE